MDSLAPWQQTALDIGKELVSFGIREYMRHPRPLPSVPQQVLPSPAPNVRYQPPSGCVWCGVVKQVASVPYFLQQANLYPQFADYYRKLSLSVLEETRGTMASAGGVVYELTQQVTEIQNLLGEQNPQFGPATLKTMVLIQECLLGAQGMRQGTTQTTTNNMPAPNQPMNVPGPQPGQPVNILSEVQNGQHGATLG